MAAATAGLAPAGSSTYSSNILHVGDGTWDSERDDFLLPPLVGLNFEAMRYNGMGNRFATLPEYHTLILGHGVLAAATFLFIVPFAILTANFYHRDPRLALRIHISLMAITVILVTVIFILGYFAVGPVRSLTNPHHGIGLAIYVLIIFQAFSGWIIKAIEKGKVRYYVPVKLMLHQWLGRAIALLGFTQIALGLTLYGSPRSLFVLYALYGAFLLTLYFVLSFQTHKRMGMGYDDENSFYTATATSVTQRRENGQLGPRPSGLQRAAGAVGLGTALATMRRQLSGAHRRQGSDSAMLTPHGQDPYMEAESNGYEKPVQHEQSGKEHTWRNRIIGAAAALGVFEASRRLFRKKNGQDEIADASSYARPPRVLPANSSTMRVNDMEEGRRPDAFGAYGPVPRSYAPEQAGSPSPQNASAYATGARPSANTRHFQEATEMPRRGSGASEARHGATSGITDLSYAESIDNEPHRRTRAGLWASIPGLAAAARLRSLFRRARNTEKGTTPTRPSERADDPSRMPYADMTPRRDIRDHPRIGPSANLRDQDSAEIEQSRMLPIQQPAASYGSPNRSRMTMPLPSDPPAPPAHQSHSPSASYGSPARLPRSRRTSPRSHRSYQNPASPVSYEEPSAQSQLRPPAAPFASRSQSRSQSVDSAEIESPPVSVKVKMHNDGRHVTLRRLSEEEAARERESRRPDRRLDPSSDPTGVATSSRMYAQSIPTSDIQAPSASASAQRQDENVGYAPSDTNPTEYDVNRRRRRAERARLQQQGANGREYLQASTTGKSVEFE